ncbi:MAG: helix-turn-helix domain-containing protein [Candidatus Komeilibacteria bacterium]
MNSFITKKVVSHQTVPETLRKTREEQSLELVDVSKKLNIQVKYLEALEDGAYESLPGEVYAQQWLRSYGKLLDLDIRWLIKEYDREKGVQMQFTGFDRPSVHKDSWLSWLNPKTLRATGIALATFAFIFYIGTGVYNIIKPPSLLIHEPANNITTDSRLITISGETDPEIELTINNELVLADANGDFAKDINLSLGLNILEVTAVKKHGAQKQITISVFRQEQQVNRVNTSLSIQSDF